MFDNVFLIAGFWNWKKWTFFGTKMYLTKFVKNGQNMTCNMAFERCLQEEDNTILILEKILKISPFTHPNQFLVDTRGSFIFWPYEVIIFQYLWEMKKNLNPTVQDLLIDISQVNIRPILRVKGEKKCCVF